MTLTQAVLEIFCTQGSIGLQWESRTEKKKNKKKKKKNGFPLIFVLIPYIKFQDHISNGS